MIERLTKRNSNGDVASHVDPQKQHMLFVNRLASYEDSGLSPEEVQELKVSVKICEDCWNHAQAKAEGRLVVLPCKVGQRVWVIKDGKIDEGFVKWFDTGDPLNPQWTAAIQDAPRGPVFVPIESVYITREEAEKALQEGSE
jgi:hypothetical protein